MLRSVTPRLATLRRPAGGLLARHLRLSLLARKNAVSNEEQTKKTNYATVRRIISNQAVQDKKTELNILREIYGQDPEPTPKDDLYWFNTLCMMVCCYIGGNLLIRAF
jgi:hypothetical protein